MARELCLEHSGIMEKVEDQGRDISTLKGKWDSMQKLLITTLVTTIISMMGIVVTLIMHLLGK